MATSFFGGAFFSGEFFNTGSVVAEVVVKTGTGGIDPPRAYKPTGLLHRPRKDVEKRVEETREIHADIAGKLARELREGLEETPISGMTLSEIDAEIGVLLRKVQRTQEEEILLLMLMMTCA